jgi:hypothetical protein
MTNRYRREHLYEVRSQHTDPTEAVGDEPRRFVEQSSRQQQHRSHVRAAMAAAAAFAMLAAPAPSAIAHAPHASVPQWERALALRSRTLDQHYQLGSFRPIALGLHLSLADRDAAWLRALQLRSEGLDRVHQLGSFQPLPAM